MVEADTILAVPPDATCLECGYSLQRLTVARCPECGRSFDPANVQSMYTRDGRRHRRRLAVQPTLVFLAVAWATSVLLTLPDYWFKGSAVFFGIVIGLMARGYVRSLILAGHTDPETRRDRRSTRRLTLIAFVLGFLQMFQFWCCPHGYSLVLGPYQFTWTGEDGMCRNRYVGYVRHRVGPHLSWYDLREYNP